MHASIGDRLRIHSNQVGTPDHCGQITEIRGENGAPPYLVRFEDGHERLVFPGGDAIVETAEPAESTQPSSDDTALGGTAL